MFFNDCTEIFSCFLNFVVRPYVFVPEASKSLALDPLIPQRGTQDTTKHEAQASRLGELYKPRHSPPPHLPSLARRHSQLVQSKARSIFPRFQAPTRPIIVLACLHRPIGALLGRWAGLQQPLPDKPWATTRWKAEEEEAEARTTRRRGSTAGTQATLMVSPSWRRHTPASPSPQAGAAGSLC